VAVLRQAGFAKVRIAVKGSADAPEGRLAIAEAGAGLPM